MNRFLEALGVRFDMDPAQFAMPGLTVVADADRAGTRRQSRWHVDRHDVVLCDPELLDATRVGTAALSAEATAAADIGTLFRRWALAQGATILGCGLSHVIDDGAPMPQRPTDVVMLDATDPTTVELAQALLEACSPGDRDDADFDLDDLDEFLAGWVVDGRLRALAGGRPFDELDGIRDVGVIVHPADRQLGMGRAVVAAVVDAIHGARCTPLYRCDVDNIGSARLCRGLGFVQLVDVEAFEWPEHTAP